MNKKSTQTINGTQVCKSRGHSKKLNAIWSLVLLTILFTAGCKKDKFKAVEGVCPLVVTDPMDKAVDVALTKVISATFNTPMDSATINKNTFIIKQGSTVVSGKVTPTGNAAVYNFTPDVPLSPFTVYTGTITTAAKDKFHTALVNDNVWTFTTIPQVTLTANPVAGGTTGGAGTFAQGAVVSVTATPAAGYVFTNWTDNTVVASTSSSYQFTLAGNRALVANFAVVTLGKVALTLSANPAAGGTTAGQGQYAIGSTVTAIATPNAGYTFVNWTNNGTIVSASSSYQFVLAANTVLVANFNQTPVSQFAVVLSSNPAIGGTTTGSGSFSNGTSVTVTALPNIGYTFTNWTDNGVVASTSPAYTFALSANRTLVANFLINTFTLTTSAVNGSVAKNPIQATYNFGSTVQLTATPNTGYIFSSWSGDASGSVNPLTVTMNSNKNITANFTAIVALGPTLPGLGGAANFTILTESGISTTGVTSITGNIGVSPITSTAITGFGLVMDSNNQSSTTPIVTGKVYSSDYAVPTPANLTTAINDMETAYTTSNNLVTPAPVNGLGAGNISGLILPAGLYKWGTSVLITNAGVTLNGGPNDTWVFQIGLDLTVNNSAIIHLTGGAQAKNIYWVVAGQATLGTNANLSGNILSKNLISLNTGAKVTGRLLAQKAVTLDASTVVLP